MLTEKSATHDPLVGKVAKRIQALREERAFTRAELSKRAGLSTAYLTALELGTFAPNTNTLGSIAVALNVNLCDLLNHDPNDDAGAIIEMMRRRPDLVPEIRHRIQRLVVN